METTVKRIQIGVDIELGNKICIRTVKRDGELIYREELYSLDDWNNRKGHKTLNEIEQIFIFSTQKTNSISCYRHNICKYRHLIRHTQCWLINICLKFFKLCLKFRQVAYKKLIIGRKTTPT